MGRRPLSSASPLPQHLQAWPNPLPSPVLLLLLLPRAAAIPFSSSKPLPRPRRSSSSPERVRDVEALAERCRFFFNIYKHHCDAEDAVLVPNIPPDPDESICEVVEHFFLANHPDHYVTHQILKHTPLALPSLTTTEERTQQSLKTTHSLFSSTLKRLSYGVSF